MGGNIAGGSNPFLTALLIRQAKRRVFVSYHHRGDQAYYESFSKTFCDMYDVISDTSVERQIESDDAEYVMRQIRDNYISGSSCTIVLVGRDTWGRKYVDWEIKATLDKQHGLIGVLLPNVVVNPQNVVYVPARLDDNIQSQYAIWVTWQTLIESAQACTQLIEAANARDKAL